MKEHGLCDVDVFLFEAEVSEVEGGDGEDTAHDERVGEAELGDVDAPEGFEEGIGGEGGAGGGGEVVEKF